MRIIKDVKEIPKATIADISSDIILVTLERQVSADGLVRTTEPVGKTFRIKPNTLQNAIVTDENGNEHNKVIVNCYDENGKYLHHIFFELLSISNNMIPNQFNHANKINK